MKLPQAVVVHGLADAMKALSYGQPVTLLSARGAAIYAGVGWWRALVALARAECGVAEAVAPDLLDCGDAPGRALEALRAGQRALVLHLPADGAVFRDIAERAVGLGGWVVPQAPVALDLAERGAAWRLAAWLDRPGGEPAGPSR